MYCGTIEEGQDYEEHLIGVQELTADPGLCSLISGGRDTPSKEEQDERAFDLALERLKQDAYFLKIETYAGLCTVIFCFGAALIIGPLEARNRGH